MCPVPRREPPVPYPPASWMPPPPFMPGDRTEERRLALAHQEDLENALGALFQTIKSGQQNQAALETAALIAQKHAAGLREFLSTCVPARLYNEKRSDSSTAAQRTFDVAELLDMILGQLEIPDIVKMRQVSRSLKDSIESSTKLQDALSLRAAAPDTHIHFAFGHCLYKVGGFSCTLDQYGETYRREAVTTHSVRAYFFPFAGERLPRIGDLYRRMFICQPPISRMEVYLTCCPRESRSRRWYQKEVSVVSAADGLTIGHLYDCARKLMDEHRYCPFASTYSLHDDGVVKMAVQFKGEVSLPLDHPIQREQAASAEAMKEHNEWSRAREAKLNAYRDAKIQAHKDGERIPTLHEFETVNVGTDWMTPADPQYMNAVPTQWPSASFVNPFDQIPTLPPPPPPPPPPPRDWDSNWPTSPLDDFDFDAFLAGT